ncbi:MAG: ISNCY family transposase, partial [Nitrososphaera sp.]|nr:ISNCY family transposase [Nitrososphaera sp.]
MDRLLRMSAKELSRLEVMQRLSRKQMSQKEAGTILGLSVRQIKRLLKAYREKGTAGLVSKQRGRKANNRLSEEVKKHALNLLKTKYRGFGPTLAHEKLVEREKLKLSDESVRQLMIAEDLWKARKVRKVTVHQLRERRACFGELIQIDGSPHDWFEGRAEPCVLLVFIDDATGKLLQLLFVESESFFSYCQAAESYFRQAGKPVAFYSDKHSIFRVNQPSAGSHGDLTQFGRAMQELDIQIICANSPQAKGRVERVIQTLQDRLPKEMRLQGICNMTDGNAYLPDFLVDLNQRFAVEPRSSVDAHRPLTAKEDLTRILTWQETRTLSKNLTLQFEKVVYQIQTKRPTYALRNAQVTVCVNAQQEITILYNGKALPYTIYSQQAKQAEIVSTKQLDQALHERQLPPKPAPDHPWRRGFATPLSKRRNVTPAPAGDISILENRGHFNFGLT